MTDAPVQIRWRRETSAWLAANVGGPQELIINTDTNRVHIMDGVTPGGFPAAKLTEVGGSGTLSISGGGTGATTALQARANLGAAARGENSDITSLTGLTAALSVPQGGTGATSALGARTSIGAAALGANSDITSLTGLTTALSIAQGGTGATSAANARTGLGAAASGANNDILSLSGLTTALSITQGGTGGNDLASARNNLGVGPLNNFAATLYPTSGNDSTQGYAVGSRWMLPSTGEMFFCRNASAGAAIWNRADNADFFGYVANRWYLPYGISAYGAGGTQVAGRIHFYPFINKQRCTISAIGLRVTTAAAGGNVQAAIYAADPTTKRPTGTPLCQTASMSTATVGPVSANVSCQLEPGVYWIGVNSDNTTVVYVGVASTSVSVQQLIGSTTQANVMPSATGGLATFLTGTFGTWPDMTGVTFNESNTAQNILPLVQFQIGSVP